MASVDDSHSREKHHVVAVAVGTAPQQAPARIDTSTVDNSPCLASSLMQLIRQSYDIRADTTISTFNLDMSASDH